MRAVNLTKWNKVSMTAWTPFKQSHPLATQYEPLQTSNQTLNAPEHDCLPTIYLFVSLQIHHDPLHLSFPHKEPQTPRPEFNPTNLSLSLTLVIVTQVPTYLRTSTTPKGTWFQPPISASTYAFEYIASSSHCQSNGKPNTQ